MGEALKRLKDIKGIQQWYRTWWRNIVVIHLKMNVYKEHVKTVSSIMFTAGLRMREIQVGKTVQLPLTRK